MFREHAMHIRKSTMDVYDIQHQSEWATIALREWTRDPAPERGPIYCGEILIHSSYGAWAYTWTSCGSPFRTFLAEIDFGYAFSKFMGHGLREFDANASLAAIQRKIIDLRRSRDISEKTARMAYACVDNKAGYIDNTSEFITACDDIRSELQADDTPEPALIALFVDPWDSEFTRHRSNPSAVAFWNKLWGPFIDALKSEQTDTAGAPA